MRISGYHLAGIRLVIDKGMTTIPNQNKGQMTACDRIR